MGEHRPETISKLLDSWLTISRNEIKALSEGEMDELHRLVELSTKIQKHLESMPDFQEAIRQQAQCIDTIHKIRESQDILMQGMQQGALALKEKISTLQRNTPHFKSYQQEKRIPSKFFNKRT